MSNHPAARVGDWFGHDAQFEGMVAGVALGALVAVGVVATGGLGAVAIGAALATTGAAGLAGAVIGRHMDGPDTGELDTGSADIRINCMAATMVQLATGRCRNHGGTPRLVATGSASVRFNRRPAARIGEEMDCHAVIRTGSSTVIIGGPKQSPVCSALRGEQATFERFRIDAQAASAAYDPPEIRKAPDGYRNATAGDLKKLGLDQSMLEHPMDPKRENRPSFAQRYS